MNKGSSISSYSPLPERVVAEAATPADLDGLPPLNAAAEAAEAAMELRKAPDLEPDSFM